MSVVMPILNVDPDCAMADVASMKAPANTVGRSKRVEIPDSRLVGMTLLTL